MVYMEKEACPEKKDFLRGVNTSVRCRNWDKPKGDLEVFYQTCCSPGLLHFALRPLALVVGDVAQRAVDGGEVRFAHVQEVRAHAAHRHFGDVGERLADGAAEDEHAHLLVERRDVGVPHERLGALVQEVDPVALADDDLEETPGVSDSRGGGRSMSSGHFVMESRGKNKMF